MQNRNVLEPRIFLLWVDFADQPLRHRGAEAASGQKTFYSYIHKFLNKLYFASEIY